MSSPLGSPVTTSPPFDWIRVSEPATSQKVVVLRESGGPSTPRLQCLSRSASRILGHPLSRVITVGIIPTGLTPARAPPARPTYRKTSIRLTERTQLLPLIWIKPPQ